MDLKKIFSISGKSGLHRLVATSKNGVIVESLETQKRFHAYSTAKISSLEDITIYTLEEDKPLKEVLIIIGAENDFKAIALPKKEEMLSVFEGYLPDFDSDRVYASDIKKIFSWYNLLIKSGDLIPEEEVKDEQAAPKKEVEVDKPAEEDKKEKAKKTTQAKKQSKAKADNKAK